MAELGDQALAAEAENDQRERQQMKAWAEFCVRFEKALIDAGLHSDPAPVIGAFLQGNASSGAVRDLMALIQSSGEDQ